MVKILLVLLFIPHLGFSQVPREALTEEALEVIDTSSLNNISAQHLWQIFGLPKDAIFHFISYRNTFGSIAHTSELYYIDGLDTLTVEYLLDMFPLKRVVENSKGQVVSKSSLSNGNVRLSNSLLLRHHQHRAALHTVLENFKPTYNGYISSSTKNSKWLIGDYSVHCGQGILLGRPGFPSPTTNEYFRFGLGGQTGVSSSGMYRGVAWQHQNKGNTFLGALNQTSPLLIWQKNRSIYSYGVGLKGSEWTVFGKYYEGPLRVFSEVTREKQHVGGNLLYQDVLFEFNVLRTEEGLTTRKYLSWQDRLGRWHVIHNDGILRVQLQNKNLRIFVNEHRTGTIERSYRWKLQLQRSKINYDLHWHQGTYGLSIRHSWLHGPAKYHLLFAAVDYRGSPVWLGIPAARGYLGAVAIHEDFSGIVAKVAIGPLQIGTTINFENIPKSALQMSYFTSL